MTMYKMSINYQLSMYCNNAINVQPVIAYIIWLVLVPIFVYLQAMLLAIVTDQQNRSAETF